MRSAFRSSEVNFAPKVFHVLFKSATDGCEISRSYFMVKTPRVWGWKWNFLEAILIKLKCLLAVMKRRALHYDSYFNWHDAEDAAWRHVNFHIVAMSFTSCWLPRDGTLIELCCFHHHSLRRQTISLWIWGTNLNSHDITEIKYAKRVKLESCKRNISRNTIRWINFISPSLEKNTVNESTKQQEM